MLIKKIHFVLIIMMIGTLDNLNAQKFSSENQHQINNLNEIINNVNSHDTTLVNAYLRLGYILYNSNIDTLLSICTKAQNISEKALSEQPSDIVALTLRKALASALNNIGYVHKYQGNIPLALEYYHKSLKIKEEIGNQQSIATAFDNIGSVHDDQGNFTLALENYLKSLKKRLEYGNQQEIASSFNNIGHLYHVQGDISLALKYYHKSLIIQEEIGDKQGIATSLNNIGAIHQNQGDMILSAEYIHKSLKIRKEIGDQRGVASSYNNMGYIHQAQGFTSLALEYYHKSLKIKEEIGDQPGIASALNNIGAIYQSQGNINVALEFYQKSLKISTEIGNKNDITNSLNNIGVIYQEQGNLPLALKLYQGSLKAKEEIGDQPGVAVSLNNIGLLYQSQGKYAEALKNMNRAYEIVTNIGEDIEIINLARSLYQTYLLTDSLTLAKKYLSVFYSRRNQNLQTNFFSLSENEKQSYFSTMETDYGMYHDFALNFQVPTDSYQFDNVTDTSYNITLQNKGLTLKSSTAMRQAIQNSGDSTLINEYEHWLSLKKKIAKTNEINSAYKDLVRQANEMERDLVKTSNVFSDFDKVRNLKWQDVQSGLKQNEVAIEFVHFKSEIDTANPIIYAALIIKKDSKHPEMVKLCTEADLKEILGTFQGNNLNFVNSVYGNKEKVQTALYEKVWKPMEKNLEGVENIYLSPSGLLHKVAFNAIAKDQNTYLCDTYNIHQQNSTGKVALPDEVTFNKDQKFFIMGGVKYNTDTTANEVWSYLPGTLEETKSIKSFLEKKKFQVTHLTAKKADEGSFKAKAPEANILHIATHGFFFPDPEQVRASLKENEEYHEDLAFRGNNINPEKMQRPTRYADWTFVKNKNPLMRSGITLANANDVWQRNTLAEGEDGILTAQEVSTLDLRNTNLVVLSACETGLGDIKGSEGVYGLQRAFKMAGAKYLIMSLWQVPDKETSEFMQLFYKNLVKIKNIPKAFEQTQKVMRKKYDPYYWAAFVLVE